MGVADKPDCIITSDGKNLTIKTESAFKTTRLSCNLGGKFEETTADDRKTQTTCSFVNSTLVQQQGGMGKKSRGRGRLEGGETWWNVL
ncbi:hypothetical protein HJG60_004715 [Phyllostomus discolor]|uniref:Uncharacterized protein n=1 Tax=Phyllostomus discolor TaxID=89673 RepID=A0A834AAB1_9CHIR|nr:hypothetical protein HJG60_004715 [Phyllostomus discolor]